MKSFNGSAVPRWTGLPLSAGVAGFARYAVVGGACYVDMVVTFPSTTAATTRFVVDAGGLPDDVRPASGARTGWFSYVTAMGRIAVNADGSVVCIPLTDTAAGATGIADFPAGL